MYAYLAVQQDSDTLNKGWGIRWESEKYSRYEQGPLTNPDVVKLVDKVWETKPQTKALFTTPDIIEEYKKSSTSKRVLLDVTKHLNLKPVNMSYNGCVRIAQHFAGIDDTGKTRYISTANVNPNPNVDKGR